MIEPDLFLKALVTTLGTHTGRPFALNEPPGENPSSPYGLVIPGPLTEVEGGFEHVQWMEMRILLGLFGKTTEQVSWLQGRVMNGLLFTRWPITVNGEDVTWRTMGALGGISDAGYSLFQCNDQYRFRLEA